MVFLLALAALIVLLVVLQGVAGFYANFLWFHWSGVGEVWTGVTLTKVLLVVVFVAFAFCFVFGSLLLVDRVVRRTLFLSPDSEFVHRFQQVTAAHAMALRTGVAALLALALGSGAGSQWKNWLLFTHSVPFGVADPQFGRDDSFFVFRLPFLSYLVDWLFGLLVVAFLITALAYFLNGAIRLQRAIHVEPRVIAHLSLLLSLMALERAWAYFYVDRFGLDLSTDGVVSGAGYADVHVRLPAILLLAVVCLVAFVMLAFNVYQRTLVLPVVAVGLWAFLALVVGVIVPKIYQAVHVTPAQSRLELSYIQRNINATNDAYRTANVTEENFAANQDLTPSVLARYATTLNDVQLWDPVYSYPTFENLEKELGFYNLTSLTVDRYPVNGQLTPVVVGVRELNTAGVPAQTWVNTHLQFTHGYAAAIAPSNTTAPNSNGSPQFVVGAVPVTTSIPSLAIKAPYTAVYFAPGDEQYVIANTGQSEVDYQLPDGKSIEGHYTGSGGIPMTFGARLAFSVKLHDFNLLISSLVNPKSRLIYIPDVRAAVQKALPFLTIDSNPYAVIDNGQIDWVVDAYATTNDYPYAQPARTDELSPLSALNGNYNYVRDAVKVVVNAYSGKMSFYTVEGHPDPLMQAYEQAFPHMFKPLSSLQQSDPALLQHLRYPQDLLSVQSAMFSRYHITKALDFYGSGNAWDISQTSAAVGGSPSQKNLPLEPNGTVQRFQPIYEMLQLPGESSVSFDAVEPFVPYSSTGTLQNLAGLMVADSAPGPDYGRLVNLVTPTGSEAQEVDGPGLANADILADPDVSKVITLLDQNGSNVTLGAVQVLPLADSLLYVRPLYVSSAQTAYPKLQDVIVVYGKQVSLGSTLASALTGIFGNAPAGESTGNVSAPTGGATTSIPSDVRNDIATALTDYSQAQAALTAGDLGTYQSDVTKAGQLLQKANSLLSEGGSTNSPSAAASAKQGPVTGSSLRANPGHPNPASA